MEKIKPMQLWKTNHGGYAFIAKVNFRIGVAFGFSFNCEQEITFREWDVDTGLWISPSHEARLYQNYPTDVSLYECVYDAESYKKLDKKGIKLIADQLLLLCDKL